jgi:hypothetical protein
MNDISHCIGTNHPKCSDCERATGIIIEGLQSWINPPLDMKTGICSYYIRPVKPNYSKYINQKQRNVRDDEPL